MKPSNDERSYLRAPAGTCDTRMHIYERAYPKAPTAKIDAPDAPVSEYLKVRKRLGIERTVVVQPSTYGTDNRCTLAAIKALGSSARGVAVVDQTVTDPELDRLTKLGICGIRFHMLPGGALPWEILEMMAARGIGVAHTTILRWVTRYVPEFEKRWNRFARSSGAARRWPGSSRSRARLSRSWASSWLTGSVRDNSRSAAGVVAAIGRERTNG